MARDKGIISLFSKKKIEEIIVILFNMFKKHGIHSSIKNYRNNETANYTSEGGKSTEMNLWDVKRLKSVISEKNDQIFQLESTVLNFENTKMSESNSESLPEKQIIEIVMDKESDFAYTQAQNLIEENKSLRIKTEKLVSKTQDEMAVLKKELEMLKYSKCNPSVLAKTKSTEFMDYHIKAEEYQEEIRNLNSKIEDRERDIQLLKEDKLSYIEKIRSYERNLEICEIRISKFLENTSLEGNKIIIDELKSVSESFEEILRENKLLLNTITEMRSKNKALEHETIEMKNKLRARIRLDELLEYNKKKIENIKKEIVHELTEYKTKYSDFENFELEMLAKINGYKKDIHGLNAEIMLLQSKLNDAHKTIQTNTDTLIACRSTSLELSKKNKILEERNKAFEYFYVKGTNVTELIDQLDYYKQELYCSSCKLNTKTHIIDKCMHCFCEDCLIERLKIRMRTCPKCKVEYSKENIRKIYL